MKAGRELDALIAEKVMGGKIGAGFYMKWPGENGWKRIANYSTDIVAAWEVVEKLKSPFHFDLWRAPYRAKEISWSCSFSKSIDARDIVRGDAETAPHAICLAALKAVVTEKENRDE